MQASVVFVREDSSDTKVVNKQTVKITGELYHRLDKKAIVRKAKERIRENLNNGSTIDEIISVSV